MLFIAITTSISASNKKKIEYSGSIGNITQLNIDHQFGNVTVKHIFTDKFEVVATVDTSNAMEIELERFYDKMNV